MLPVDSGESPSQIGQHAATRVVPLSLPVKVRYGKEGMREICNFIQEPVEQCFKILSDLKKEKKSLKKKKNQKEKICRLEEQINIFRKAVQGLLVRVLYLVKNQGYANDEEYASKEEYRIVVFQPDLKAAQIDYTTIPSRGYARIYLESEAILFDSPIRWKAAHFELWIGPKVKRSDLIQLELEQRLIDNGKGSNATVKVSRSAYR